MCMLSRPNMSMEDSKNLMAITVDIIGPLAQLVERRIFNPKVEGSNPSWLILASVVEQVYTLRLGRSFLWKCEFDSRHLQV